MKTILSLLDRGGRSLLLATLCATLHASAIAAPANATDDIDALMRQAAEDDARNAATLAAPAPKPANGLRGFAQFELARTISDPAHWSKMRTRLEFGSGGKSDLGFKWKWNLRAAYDHVFDATNFYPTDVRRDQRASLDFGETYIDKSLGNWDLRIGRQHVVWGEMVGMFIADVVSARELREFILPDFNTLRIPQWAARAEYFKDDFLGELLWVPLPSYDKVGKPGADYFPYQPEMPGVATSYRNEITPARKLGNGNFGFRGGVLKNGWDLAGFFYRSMDVAPTFARQVILAPQPELIYQARHDRISQAGGSLTKDFGDFVLKSEAVYTRGRQQTVLRATEPTGLVPQDTVDWAVSLDIPFESETRLNLQAFQTATLNRDPDIIPKKFESGYSVLVNSKLTPKIEGEILWAASLDRNDWMLRPKLNWSFERNWRFVVGADVFYGPPTGYFGRYGDKDRVYTELRYSY